MLKNTKINNMPHYTIRTYCRFQHYYSIMNYSWGTPSECLSLLVSYSAVHSDLRLLNGDAFSVYNSWFWLILAFPWLQANDFFSGGNCKFPFSFLSRIWKFGRTVRLFGCKRTKFERQIPISFLNRILAFLRWQATRSRAWKFG